MITNSWRGIVSEKFGTNSQNAIIVKKSCEKGKSKKRKTEIIVGHIADALSKVLAHIIDYFKILYITARIDVEHHLALEGIWVPGGVIEMPSSGYMEQKSIRKTFENEIMNPENLSVLMKNIVNSLHINMGLSAGVGAGVEKYGICIMYKCIYE